MSHIAVPLMQLQLQLRVFHWQTKWQGRHEASGELIEKLVGHTDKFMEVYQAIYGRIKLGGEQHIVLSDVCDKEIMNYLKQYVHFLKQLDPHIKGHNSLTSIRDALLEDMQIAMYLFSFQG